MRGLVAKRGTYPVDIRLPSTVIYSAGKACVQAVIWIGQHGSCMRSMCRWRGAGLQLASSMLQRLCNCVVPSSFSHHQTTATIVALCIYGLHLSFGTTTATITDHHTYPSGPHGPACSPSPAP